MLGNKSAPTALMGITSRTSESLADRGSRVDPPTAPSLRGSAGVLIYENPESEFDSASETRELALRLADHPFPTQIVSVKTQLRLLADVQARTTSKTSRRLARQHVDLAKSVLYQSGAPTNWNLDFYGRYRVGRAAFGTDRIPGGWAEQCNDLDELWLPSEFHRETFTAFGVERSKIHVIPQGVETRIFHPERAPLRFPSVPQKSFQFTAISDGMLAAGVDVLIRAFVEEFSPDEDVALSLHCPPKRRGDSYIDFELEVIELLETVLNRDIEDIPTIALVMGSFCEEDRAGFFAASHAFLHPARADANGQHCIEALACRLPVIATDWGPLSDSLNDQNSFPVATNGLVAAQPDEDELVVGHRWAEPNLSHLRHQMREVFENPTEAARRAKQGRETVSRFGWNTVLPEWVRNFERLLE